MVKERPPVTAPSSFSALLHRKRVVLSVGCGGVGKTTTTAALGVAAASAGLGLSWISPVGPLKLSWGVPIKKKPEDKIQKFQFQIGTAF